MEETVELDDNALWRYEAACFPAAKRLSEDLEVLILEIRLMFQRQHLEKKE